MSACSPARPSTALSDTKGVRAYENALQAYIGLLGATAHGMGTSRPRGGLIVFVQYRYRRMLLDNHQ
jgi:hypothetical protein